MVGCREADSRTQTHDLLLLVKSTCYAHNFLKNVVYQKKLFKECTKLCTFNTPDFLMCGHLDATMFFLA